MPTNNKPIPPPTKEPSKRGKHRLVYAEAEKLRREQGMTLAQIGKKFGVSKQVVWSILSSKARFGGKREIVIKRDGEKCVKCGMTRIKHRKVFGIDITVDHINRKSGRFGKNRKVVYKTKDMDNRLSNLRTLCKSCHSRKDGIITANYWMKKVEMRSLDGKLLRVFPNSLAAAKYMNVTKSAIAMRCTQSYEGRIRSPLFGYIWKYQKSLKQLGEVGS